MARVEIRELTRSRARSALIIGLIALPVAAVVGGGIALRAIVQSPAERKVRTLGRADLRIENIEPGSVLSVPGVGGRDTLVVRRDHLVAGGLRLAAVRASIRGDGVAAPVLKVLAGRWPEAADEIGVAPVLLRAASLVIGDRVSLDSDGEDYRVVGTMVSPDSLNQPWVVDALDPDAVTDGHATLFVSLASGERPAEVTDKLRERGHSVVSAGEVLAARAEVEAAALVIGSVGLVEAALIIAAAFAIGLRRRQREVGLLRATGAEPADVVASILLSAASLALIAGLLGCGLGVLIAWSVYPFLGEWTGRLPGAFEISLPFLSFAVALGVVTSTFAAVWPARAAARMPVRVALSGRRPPPSRERSWLLGGMVLLITGVGLTWTAATVTEDTPRVVCVTLGAVLGVLGCGACSPWLLAFLARHAAHLPLPWRLAVRDAGRFRSRNGPVVTAVLAGMALSVTIAVVGASVSGEEGGPVVMRPDHLRFDGPGAEAVSARFGREEPLLARAPLRAACDRGQPVRARFVGADTSMWVAVGGADLRRTLGISTAEGVPLIAVSESPAGREVELLGRRGALPIVRSKCASSGLEVGLRSPGFLVSEEQLKEWQLSIGSPPNRPTVPWLVRTKQTVDGAMLERARTIAASVPGTTVDAAILHGREPLYIFQAVFLLSLLTGLSIIGVATALTAVESQADRKILVVVGAPPGVSRAHVGAQASYLALLGCLLAVPAGCLAAVGVMDSVSGDGARVDLVVPFWPLAMTVLGLPLLAYGGASAQARRANPVPG